MPGTKKSLQDLDGQDWGEPTFDSHVVRECHRLRRVPLRQLSPEDLRLLLGQGIGLVHLLPVALERLDADPLVAGDYHPGDLLKEVLSVPDAVWQGHPRWRRQAVILAERALMLLEEEPLVASPRVVAMLQARMRRFIG